MGSHFCALRETTASPPELQAFRGCPGESRFPTPITTGLSDVRYQLSASRFKHCKNISIFSPSNPTPENTA
jgi:hypothetical protein